MARVNVYEHVNVRTPCECLYTCENSSFTQRQRYTNVRANGEARAQMCKCGILRATRHYNLCTVDGSSGSATNNFVLITSHFE